MNLPKDIDFTNRLKAFFQQPNKAMLIDDEWTLGSTNRRIEVFNPATEKVIGTVPLAEKEDVDKAVQSAKQAFQSREWRKMLPSDRERLLHRLADLIAQNADTLAQIITLENGKILAQAKASDVMGAVETFRYYAGWCTKIEGETIDVSMKQPAGKQNFAFTRREPIGVVAAIVPWNFPISIAAWKLAPALAAGCTVVLKPSEETPLSSLLLGELILEAGFPKGVVNIVTGDGTTGASLVSNPNISKITFTGSTQTGKHIGRAAMDNLTELSLELGGKSPVIVCQDADLSEAAKGIAMGIFRNQGQVCVAGSRVYIQNKVFDKVMAEVALLGQKMKISHGFDPSADLAPLVSAAHLDKVSAYVKTGIEEGSTLISGGKRPKTKGFYLEPTIFTDTDNKKRLIQEEIFGPVLVGVPFDTIENALELANDSKLGLASSVWTKDISTAHTFIDALQAGWVFVNAPPRSDPHFPMGGYKQSGFGGRELGKAGLYQYTTLKAVNIVF
ncbi:MAG: aldehyde dehydrogenase family protein [Saprospiraceae bacterium]|nr:aldehyde dehydrogenase family protein [Saprospiraceae bacterium]